MIVLDTNHLDATSLDSLLFVMLRSITPETNHQLAISAVTFDEHIAHYSAKVLEGFKGVVNAFKQIKRFDPTVMVPKEEYSSESARQLIAEHERQIRSIFRILDVSGDSAIEALRREARRIPPASTSLDTKGSGARDVAIWLSAVQYSAENDEEVFLISKDKAFKAALSQGDLEKYGAKVTLILDIPSLLDSLATRAPVDLNVDALCDSQTVRDAVVMSFEVYDIWYRATEVIERPKGTVYTVHWPTDPVLELVDAIDVHGYVVRNSTWITARSEWRVTQDVHISVRIEEEQSILATWRVTFHVIARLLLNMADGTIGVDVIDVTDPTRLSGHILSTGGTIGADITDHAHLPGPIVAIESGLSKPCGLTNGQQRHLGTDP